MRYVLDSNVALKWVLPEADSDKATALRDDYHAGIHELIAPDIFPVECLHALTKAKHKIGLPTVSSSGSRLWPMRRSCILTFSC